MYTAASTLQYNKKKHNTHNTMQYKTTQS